MTKDFREPSLVMIEPLFALVVNTTDIDHNRAGIEQSRVS
jgi:hypothetical protein